MVIRKTVEAPKIAQTQQKSAVEEAPQVQLTDLTKLVDAALADGNFSQSEAKKLEAGIRAAPKLKADVAEHLAKALEGSSSSGKAIAISEIALSKLSQSLGVDFAPLFFRRQAQSKVVDHDVGNGLAKQSKSTADEHDVGKHREASETRLQNQKALLDGAKGLEGRPIGGLKGAAYDAAQRYAGVLESKVDEKLGPESKAFKDSVRDPIVKSCGQCVNEISKNPDTMKALGDVAGSLGTDAFKETVSKAATSVGADIVHATKMAEVNVDAVNGAVGGITAAASRVVDLAKGTRFEKQIAEHAPGLVKNVTALGAKLTGGAKVAEGVADAAKVVDGVAKGAKVVEGVAAASQAAGTTAQVAAGTAKAAGQSVPVLGQALGVITTGLAAAEFVGTCAHKPRDWKRIASAGLNTIGQAVGIFVPFVGAATTVAKLGSDAAMNAHDKKLGKEEHKAFGAGDLAPSLASMTGLATPFLESAGYDDAAAKLKGLHAKVDHLAKNGVTSQDLAQMTPAEREAMVSTLMACQSESEKLAGEAKGTPHEPAMRLLGEAFRTLVGAWRKSKNVDTAEDPVAEKNKLAGEAMEAAAKATAASAIVDAAEQKRG